MCEKPVRRSYLCGDDHLYGCAAADGKMAAFVFTHYADDDATPAEDVKVNICGFGGENGVKASYYLLNQDKDLELVREEIFCGETYAAILSAELFSSYLIVLEKL